jgi:uncharacterized membrane protein
MCNLIRLHRFASSPLLLRTVTRYLAPATLAFVAALLYAHPALAQGSFETADDILVQGDFDGDSKLDYAFWRPTPIRRDLVRSAE